MFTSLRHRIDELKHLAYRSQSGQVLLSLLMRSYQGLIPCQTQPGRDLVWPNQHCAHASSSQVEVRKYSEDRISSFCILAYRSQSGQELLSLLLKSYQRLIPCQTRPDQDLARPNQHCAHASTGQVEVGKYSEDRISSFCTLAYRSQSGQELLSLLLRSYQGLIPCPSSA